MSSYVGLVVSPSEPRVTKAVRAGHTLARGWMGSLVAVVVVLLAVLLAPSRALAAVGPPLLGTARCAVASSTASAAGASPMSFG